MRTEYHVRIIHVPSVRLPASEWGGRRQGLAEYTRGSPEFVEALCFLRVGSVEILVEALIPLLGGMKPTTESQTAAPLHIHRGVPSTHNLFNFVPYDGKNLLQLTLDGKSPFGRVWDVRLLIQEIEENPNTTVTDIPFIDKGSNNYGFHLETSDKRDLVARLARGDVNMPDFDGFPIEVQAPEARFETVVYNLLQPEPLIRSSRLLYSRAPVQHLGPKLAIPQDLNGRRLFVFEKSEGVNNVWTDLSSGHKFLLLEQLASMRAALFRYNPPLSFAAEYLLERLFKFMPPSLAMPVAPTREFWMHVLVAKIEATIRGEGEMIGWEDDNETVGPVALAAKQSLLRAIPYLLPVDDSPEGSLYRLVIEHGDFGIHNTTISIQAGSGEPLVTSLFDWETACVGQTIIFRGFTTPGYKAAVQAGKDIRKLWFTLRDWRGGNSEEFFGALGAWAEKRTRELRDS
ncbi:3-hydroxybutyryl-CoA dehydratase [Lasiosphaeria ovina]|uniref:3-hydroxybutyryl-CoA dehydratase n=1 Tax=Lasiosphaeria ovina TaxID=92902 RepID=A0AAE0KJ20_9PEZI|nr:3-hydroxybutyryl-CoA dehydratase [Lasiosphaeria ovina]